MWAPRGSDHRRAVRRFVWGMLVLGASAFFLAGLFAVSMNCGPITKPVVVIP
jgi:hypothetical protein